MGNLNSRLARYGGTTKKELAKHDPSTRRNTNAISYLKNDVPVFKPKEDVEQKVRILPTDKNLFYIDGWVHFSMGAEFDSYPCLRMKNESCPLCEYSRKMYLEGDKDAGYAFKAANQNFMRLLDRNAAGDKAFDPQLWSTSNTNLQTVQNLMVDKDTKEVISIDNMLRGRDLYFTKKKTGKFINGKEIVGFTDFGISGKDTKAGTDAQLEKILDYIESHPMSEIFNFTSAEEMASRSGIADDDGADEEGEEETASEESEETTSETETESASEESSEPEEEKSPVVEETPAERLAKLKARMSSKSK